MPPSGASRTRLIAKHERRFTDFDGKMLALLRTISGAPRAEAAGAALDAFERSPWGQKCPTVASWRRAWTDVIPVFAFPPEVRRVVYTTHALESVNAQLRTIINTRGHFPTDEAVTNLLWLALRNITAQWARGAQHWRAAMNQRNS